MQTALFSQKAEQQLPEIVWGGMGRGDHQGHEHTPGHDEFVPYLDYSENFKGVHISPQVIKLYSLNMCSLFYVKYTSVILVKTK